MKLVSWNVNGFRAICAKPDWAWFADTDADVIGLQEIKASPDQIPEEHRNPEGWIARWLPSTVRKGYSGTAVLLRRRYADVVAIDEELPGFAGEGRLIHVDFPAFHYLNVYFPNGTSSEERLAYKLAYYDAFLDHAERLRRTKPVVVCGDFNTAHRPIDLAHPKANEEHSGFLPVERAWLDRLIAHGYTDTFRHVHGDLPETYSWWSYKMRAREKNVGWRIDYFFISSELLPRLTDAWIDTSVRGSDHCPIGIELDV